MSIAKRALGLPKTSPERKKLENFLNTYYEDSYTNIVYNGKSKKIKTKTVKVLSKLKGEKVRIQDELGNQSVVSERMINYIK